MAFFFANLVIASASVADASSKGASILYWGEGASDFFRPGVRLFSNRDYLLKECPDRVAGVAFLRSSIDGVRLRVTDGGWITALTPESDTHGSSRAGDLEKQGFEPADQPSFQLFGNDTSARVLMFRKKVHAGETLKFGKFVVLMGFQGAEPVEERSWAENTGEVLYNGIVLPKVWPPAGRDPDNPDPMPVPYLQHPPDVIGIDIGRQLLVDDFLIAESDLMRHFHRAELYSENPILRAETQEEIRSHGESERFKGVCFLGHGGAFYDPSDSLFKIWYTAGWRGSLALATSKDGLHWRRPDIDGQGSNILLASGGGPGQAGGDNSLWLDLETQDPSQRLKLISLDLHGLDHYVQTSPDGKNWSNPVNAGRSGDYSSFFYNPFRKVWVNSVKRDYKHGRSRDYAESKDFLNPLRHQSVFWTGPDKLDKPHPAIGDQPQLYSLNAVAYESLLLGEFYIHLGPANKICDEGNFPKLVEIQLGYSRDGFHWSRPDRAAFIGATRKDGDWNRGYIHGAPGICFVVGDKLYFPFSAASGIAPDGSRSLYSGISIGLATLRRDGFASMGAQGRTGTLTTRLVGFSGKRLFVNAQMPKGTLRVEVRDRDGKAIEPFTLDNSIPFTGDSTLTELRWRGVTDLSVLAGRPVRFHFEMTNGSLYSFWVSQDSSGRSDGYVAAGGPGYLGVIDTVGMEALKK